MFLISCSIIFGGITSLKPAFFSLTLLSRSMIHRQTEIWQRKGEERISFTFDPRDTLLFLDIGLSFVRAAVACAILKRTSGLEPSSETVAQQYF